MAEVPASLINSIDLLAKGEIVNYSNSGILLLLDFSQSNQFFTHVLSLHLYGLLMLGQTESPTQSASLLAHFPLGQASGVSKGHPKCPGHLCLQIPSTHLIRPFSLHFANSLFLDPQSFSSLTHDPS